MRSAKSDVRSLHLELRFHGSSCTRCYAQINTSSDKYCIMIHFQEPCVLNSVALLATVVHLCTRVFFLSCQFIWLVFDFGNKKTPWDIIFPGSLEIFLHGLIMQQMRYGVG